MGQLVRLARARAQALGLAQEWALESVLAEGQELVPELVHPEALARGQAALCPQV